MCPRALEAAFEDLPESSREGEAEGVEAAGRAAAVEGGRAVTVSFAESEGGISLSLS